MFVQWEIEVRISSFDDPIRAVDQWNRNGIVSEQNVAFISKNFKLCGCKVRTPIFFDFWNNQKSALSRQLWDCSDEQVKCRIGTHTSITSFLMCIEILGWLIPRYFDVLYYIRDYVIFQAITPSIFARSTIRKERWTTPWISLPLHLPLPVHQL